MNKLLTSLNKENTNEYQLIGISSSLKEYRLAYFINRALGLDLRRLKDLRTTGKANDEVTPFSLFSYPEENNHITYYLLSNKNTRSNLIPDLRTTDYFLLIKKKIENSKIADVLNRLKRVSTIQTAFLLEISNIRDFFYILTDLEIHEIELLQN
ncbi:MAG: IPExxxVDY family protein [Hyphomicrobiales bacterium]